MCNKTGFTLIEVLVAMVVGLLLVLPIGLLSESLTRQRINSDETSAVTSLAEQQMERLLALQNPSTDPNLSAGTHGPYFIDATGTPSVGGPYQRSWVVIDNFPYTKSRKITVTVTHVNNAHAHCELVTYYKVL